MRVLALLFFLFPTILLSQSENKVEVLAKYTKNKVLIRWAPSNPYVWQLGLKYGYKIERFNVFEDGKINDQLAAKPTLLSPSPVKPYSKELFEKLVQTEKTAGVVQEAIYGEAFKTDFNSNSPSSVLKKKQELENRFGLALFVCDMSTPVAEAAGLMYTDRNVTYDTRYIYRISIANIPEDIKVEPGVIVLDIKDEKPLPAPEKLEVKFGDIQATLSWPVLFHRGLYTAYLIERSEDGKTFKSLTDLPYVNTSEKTNPENSYFVDSLPTNHKIYYYRISGITPFGENGPFSQIVSGKGHRSLDGIVTIDSSASLDNNKILIKWSLPANYEKLLQGYFVERSKTPDGPYKSLHPKLLPASQSSFVDNTATTNNYYRIKYLAKGQNQEYYSFPYLSQLMDTIPPSPPVEIVGKIDSTGIVDLSWKKNLEPDVLGYRIFRSNGLNEEFTEQTNVIIKKPFFKDTINIETLTKKVYYKVVAVDNYYNPSDYSSALSLMRPDIIEPVAPVFRKAERNGEKIELEWELSISKDVGKYQLYRIDKGIALSAILDEWDVSSNRTKFVDSTAILGKTYQYLLHAVDSAGNIGKVTSRNVYFETGVRKAVSQIKTKVDRTNQNILIEWEYDKSDISKFIIYKYREGQPIKIYKTLPGDSTKFIDNDLTINNIYIYKIKAFYKSGIQSEISGEVKIQY